MQSPRLEPKVVPVWNHLTTTDFYKEIEACFIGDGVDSENYKAWRAAVRNLKDQVAARKYSLNEFHLNFIYLLHHLAGAQVAQINTLFLGPDQNGIERNIRECFKADGTKVQFGLKIKDRKVRALYEYGRMLLVLAAKREEEIMQAEFNRQNEAFRKHVESLQKSDYGHVKKDVESELKAVDMEIQDNKEAAALSRALILNIKLNPDNNGSHLKAINSKINECKTEKAKVLADLAVLESKSADKKSDLAAVKADLATLKVRQQNLDTGLKKLKDSLKDEALIAACFQDQDMDGTEKLYFSSEHIDRRKKALLAKKEEFKTALTELKTATDKASDCLKTHSENAKLARRARDFELLEQIQLLKAKHAELTRQVTDVSSHQSGYNNHWKQIPIKLPAGFDAKAVSVEELRVKVSDKGIRKWVEVESPRMVAVLEAEIAIIDGAILKWQAERDREIPKSAIFQKTSTITDAIKEVDSLVTETSAGSDISKSFSNVEKDIAERDKAIADAAAKAAKEKADADRVQDAAISAAMAVQAAAVEKQIEDNNFARAIDPHARLAPIVIPPLVIEQPKSIWQRLPTILKFFCCITVLPWLVVVGCPLIKQFFTANCKQTLAFPPNKITSPMSAPLPSRNRARQGEEESESTPKLGRVNSAPAGGLARSRSSSDFVNRGTGATRAAAQAGLAMSLNEAAAKNLVISELLKYGYHPKPNNGAANQSVPVEKQIEWEVTNGNLAIKKPAIGLVIHATQKMITINGKTFYFDCLYNKKPGLQPMAKITGSPSACEEFMNSIRDNLPQGDGARGGSASPARALTVRVG